MSIGREVDEAWEAVQAAAVEWRKELHAGPRANVRAAQTRLEEARARLATAIGDRIRHIFTRRRQPRWSEIEEPNSD